MKKVLSECVLVTGNDHVKDSQTLDSGDAQRDGKVFSPSPSANVDSVCRKRPHNSLTQPAPRLPGTCSLPEDCSRTRTAATVII